MESFPDYIRLRRQELEKQAEPLRAQLKAIEDEIVQLNRAESVIGLSSYVLPAEAGSYEVTGNPVAFTHKRRPSENSMRATAARLLADYPQGLTAKEILPLLNKELGTDYPRSSLSPQLSRLKAEGQIERDGLVWKLTHQTNEASDNDPSAEPSEASSLVEESREGILG
jgi:DNA-binding transcriptional ArsR family regulator